MSRPHRSAVTTVNIDRRGRAASAFVHEHALRAGAPDAIVSPMRRNPRAPPCSPTHAQAAPASAEQSGPRSRISVRKVRKRTRPCERRACSCGDRGRAQASLGGVAIATWRSTTVCSPVARSPMVQRSWGPDQSASRTSLTKFSTRSSSGFPDCAGRSRSGPPWRPGRSGGPPLRPPLLAGEPFSGRGGRPA